MHTGMTIHDLEKTVRIAEDLQTLSDCGLTITEAKSNVLQFPAPKVEVSPKAVCEMADETRGE